MFTFSERLAVGSLVHKAVEIGVYAPDLSDAELVERAEEKLRRDDTRFDEFASLLTVGQKDYGQGILADLTRIYDGQDEWRRKLMTREFLIRRTGWSFGTMSSGDISISIDDCVSRLPRMQHVDQARVRRRSRAHQGHRR